jgi:hypothetical protein
MRVDNAIEKEFEVVAVVIDNGKVACDICGKRHDNDKPNISKIKKIPCSNDQYASIINQSNYDAISIIL